MGGLEKQMVQENDQYQFSQEESKDVSSRNIVLNTYPINEEENATDELYDYEG